MMKKAKGNDEDEFEMTLAQATCAGCGATNGIGAIAVYMHGMGRSSAALPARLRSSALRTQRGATWLDMRGVRVLQISAEA